MSTLKMRLEGHTAALVRAKAAHENVTRTLGAERDRAQVEHRWLLSQISGQRKSLEAVRADLKRGKVNSAQVAAEEARLARLEHLLVQAETAETLAAERLHGAELGFFPAAGRTAERSPADLERDIRQTSGEIDTLERALSEASASTPIRSSCDCVLHAASREENLSSGARRSPTSRLPADPPNPEPGRSMHFSGRTKCKQSPWMIRSKSAWDPHRHRREVV
ncbi:hypothetical protein ACFQY9_17545 [Microvirga aerilata]|uniref:hypothetical protein n=1 Tax=Microvirga aerilata TaxID=670292 RepID=UPI0036306BBF